MVNYFLNLFLAFLSIPYLYFVIKRLKKEIPRLPNARDLKGKEGEYKQSLELLFLGESAIAGVGVSSNHEGLAGQTSVALLKSLESNINWEVLAHTGYDAEMVIGILLPKLRTEPYDLILIQLCVNDVFKLTPPVYYSLRLEEIINHLKRKYPNSKLLFVNNAPIRDMAFPWLFKFILGNIMDEYEKVIQHLVAQHDDLYFIEKKLKFSDWEVRIPNKPREEFFSDGIHPSAFTYKHWAGDIAEYILEKNILSKH